MLMSLSGRLARLRYEHNAYKIVASGDHVICAVSGERIPLDTLRYWSVARQEAYASAEISLRAHTSR